MVESFKDILYVGGSTNSLGRAEEVVQVVLKNQSRLGELFDCLDVDDAWVRLRAIDSIEKVCRQHPEWLEAFKSRLFGDLLEDSQASVQWHLAQMFTEMDLTDGQRQTAMTWLADKLKNTQVDWIVAGDCMKALVFFEKKGLFPHRQLLGLLQIQQAHRSKAIAKKAAKLIEEYSR